MKKNVLSYTLNFSSFLGFAYLILFLMIALCLQDNLSLFLPASELTIIIGGTLATLIICFPINQIACACGTAFKTLCFFPKDEKKLALHIMHASEIVHTSSLLSLQKNYLDQTNNFWTTGINLLLDGVGIDQCQQMMKNKMTETYNRMMNYAVVIEKMGNLAFIMGLINALMIFSFAASGNAVPSIICGLIISCLICRPLALRIQQIAKADLSKNNLCLIGFKALDSAQNPRKTEMELNAILSEPIHYFEG